MQITDDQTKALTNAGLNLIAQALTIYDSDLRLAVCNAPFQSMFDLPDRLGTPGAPSVSKARPCHRAAGSPSIPTSPTPSGKRRCCAHVQTR